MKVQVNNKSKRIEIVAETNEEEDQLDAFLESIEKLSIWRTYDAGKKGNQMGLVLSGLK